MRVRTADVSRSFQIYADPDGDAARIARLEREVVRLRADLDRVLTEPSRTERAASACLGAQPAAVPSGAVSRPGARRLATSVPVPATARPRLSLAG